MGFDALLKRHFPLVVCLMLAVAAYFQARGLGHLVGARLVASAAAAAPGQAAAHRPAPWRDADRDLSADAILERNPFDSVTGSLKGHTLSLPAGEDSSGADADPYRDPPCEVARVVLIASADDPDWSFAAITGPDGKAVLRRRGEDFFGGKVSFIGAREHPEGGNREDWERVWLTAPNGTHCQLQLGAKPPAKPGGPPPPAAGPQSDVMSKIHRIGEHSFEVDRSAVDAMIANPAELMKTRIMPVKDGDRVVGMKISGIRQGSLLGALGIENGDQLNSLNGFEMNDPTKMLEAYNKLLHADHVTASVLRGGKPVDIDFSIK
jgi:general secretion pathway protein C